MKKSFVLLLVITLFIPTGTSALTKNESSNMEEKIVSKVEKFYKTISKTNNMVLNTNNNGIENNSYSIEITKEEYENSNNTATTRAAYVETTYKKLTSTISQNGSYYRYKAELNWKSIPSTRSYDIIGIGFYPSVKLRTSTTFSQYYCFSDGTCKTDSSNYPQIFSNGAGTSFKIPSGNLTTLKQTFYFDVEKANSSTVISQIAAADYSHATKSVTSNNAKNYTVNTSGINLGSSITSSYDAINTANATWNGNW